MRAATGNRKYIPDRNADPVLRPSLLSGSPGGLRSTVFLKTLSGTIPHSSQMLLPSDEGNGGDAGQRMRASHLAGLPAFKSSQSRGQLCHPMGSGIMGNRGSLLEEAFAAAAEPVTKAPRWARDQRRASGVKTANTGGSRDCLDAPALFTPVLEEPRDRFDAPAASPPAPKKPRSLSPRIVRGRESRAFYNRRKSVGSLAEKPNWSPPAPDGLVNATSQWCQNRQHWSKPRLPRRASVAHAST